MSTLASDRRGAVYVEFLIAVVPFFLFVLCAVQAVLLQFADLTVERAANAAARSAVVVLDDDPRFYRNEPRNSATPGGGRLEAIRRSAENVLSALSVADRPDRSTRLTVTFPGQPGSDVLRSRFGPDEIVNVRVSYLFPCGVPLAGILMCRDTAGGAAGGAASGAGFLVRAEASLPNQGARYAYAGGAP